MAKFNDKISTLINSQLPDFVIDDHPQFAKFLKIYFTFMESAELQVTSIQTTDGVLLETETNQENLLLLDAGGLGSERTQLDSGDKVILESSAFGKFTKGETITGQTSNATSTVLAEDLTNNRLYISSQDKFIKGETILGSSSNASAVINDYRPNPVTTIQQLVNHRDPDKVIEFYLNKFRDEFLATLPELLDDEVQRRNLIKNIKSLYRLKGTSKGHEIFFRILFNETAETKYPREQILRVSDGKWNTKKVIRAIDDSTNTESTNFLVGRTITGETSGATAIVENVFRYAFGGDQVSEFIVNQDTIVGTFLIDEVIRGTSSDLTDRFIKASITGIPSSKTITNDGALNEATDTITLTGGGQGALFSIDGIGSGKITDIIIDNAGFDFDIGDDLVFNNTGTQGSGASAFISVVNGGITPEDGLSDAENLFADTNIYPNGPVIRYDDVTFQAGFTSADLEVGATLLGQTSGATATIQTVGTTQHDPFDIYLSGYTGSPTFTVGETLTITKLNSTQFTLKISSRPGDTATVASKNSFWEDIRLLGTLTTSTDHIVLEDATTDGDLYFGQKIVQETGTGIKDVTDIFIISGGNGYKSLPTISFSSASSGKDGTFKSFGSEIGRILNIKTLEPGIQHQLSPSPPTVELFNNSIVITATGNFIVGETITSSSGATSIVVSYNNSTGVLKSKDVSGTLSVNNTLTGSSSGATAIIAFTDHAEATINISAVADTDGEFLNEDGHVSENTMRVQDSLYYQDFSYVIKIGRAINDWRDSFKKTMHAAGFYFAGEVDITSRINARISSPVVGQISGAVDDPFLSILNTLFSTLFGRRLGTESDGTSLRANALIPADVDLDPDTIEHFPANTRDVTLKSKFAITTYVSRVRHSIGGFFVKQGFAYAGPRWGSLNKYANTVYGTTNPGSHITFQVLGNLKIFGTNTALNETPAIFTATSDPNGQKLKSNFAFPCEVAASSNDFSNTLIKFDSNLATFDDTTP
jgi:hypothetical protein